MKSAHHLDNYARMVYFRFLSKIDVCLKVINKRKEPSVCLYQLKLRMGHYLMEALESYCASAIVS